MQFEIIAPEKQFVTDWSGGRTRELFIEGGAASYAERDFTLRLSTASVRAASSIFTSLPAFNRALMPLSGTIRLTHDGGRPLTLTPFQTSFFDGGGQTRSMGTCQDFNVMWAKTEPLSVKLEAPAVFPFQRGGMDEDFYYAYRGNFVLHTHKKKISVDEGSLLHLVDSGYAMIQQVGKGPAQIVHVSIERKEEAEDDLSQYGIYEGLKDIMKER